jgi:hypothetical protein
MNWVKMTFTEYNFPSMILRSLFFASHGKIARVGLIFTPITLTNILFSVILQSKKGKAREPKEENVTLGPTVRDGEHVFGVAHIFASFNDTFVVSFLVDSSLFAVLQIYVRIVAIVFSYVLNW